MPSDLLPRLVRPSRVQGFAVAQYSEWGLLYKARLQEYWRQIVQAVAPETIVVETPVIANPDASSPDDERYRLDTELSLRHSIHDNYPFLFRLLGNRAGADYLSLFESGLVFRKEAPSREAFLERLNAFHVIAVHIFGGADRLSEMTWQVHEAITHFGHRCGIPLAPQLDPGRREIGQCLPDYTAAEHRDSLASTLAGRKEKFHLDYLCHFGGATDGCELFSIEVMRHSGCRADSLFVLDVTLGSVERLLLLLSGSAQEFAFPPHLCPFHVAVPPERSARWQHVRPAHSALRTLAVNALRHNRDCCKEVQFDLVPWEYTGQNDKVRTKDGRELALVEVLDMVHTDNVAGADDRSALHASIQHW